MENYTLLDNIARAYAYVTCKNLGKYCESHGYSYDDLGAHAAWDNCVMMYHTFKSIGFTDNDIMFMSDGEITSIS